MTPLALVAATCWCALVALSQVYAGQHSPAGVVAGAMYAVLSYAMFMPLAAAVYGSTAVPVPWSATPASILAPCALVRPCVLTLRTARLVTCECCRGVCQPVCAWALLLLYPTPYRYTRTLPKAAIALGAMSGFALGAVPPPATVWLQASQHLGPSRCAASDALGPMLTTCLRSAIGMSPTRGVLRPFASLTPTRCQVSPSASCVGECCVHPCDGYGTVDHSHTHTHTHSTLTRCCHGLSSCRRCRR